MTGVFSDIESSLNSRLSSAPGLPAVQWPNVKYQPKENITFVRPTILPATTELYRVNDGSLHRGIYQVDVFAPLEKGTKDLNEVLDSIEEHFRASRSLTSGTHTVFIQAIGRGIAQRQESWYVSFVEINYICYT